MNNNINNSNCKSDEKIPTIARAGEEQSSKNIGMNKTMQIEMEVYSYG